MKRNIIPLILVFLIIPAIVSAERIEIPMMTGWNLIGFPLNESMGLEEAFASISGNYDYISGYYSTGPKSWAKGRPINDLTTILPYHGYWIYMNKSDVLVFEMDVVQEASIALNTGWNLIGFPLNESMGLEEAFASISGDYDYISGYYEDGPHTWAKGRSINDLTTILPYHGYWIKMTKNKTLYWARNTEECSDGTLAGQCSTQTIGKYCLAGTLLDMCYGLNGVHGDWDDCSCTGGMECRSNGICRNVTTENATKIMPLGDSLTLGKQRFRDPGSPMIGYRKPLWNMLRDDGYDVDFVGSVYTGDYEFDMDHEGYDGWTDTQIGNSVYGFLESNPADIVLLHIGTNGVDTNPYDVENILNKIKAYGTSNNKNIKVIVARIMNRGCCTDNPPCSACQTTTTFNRKVAQMISSRRDPNVIVVDMENGAGLDYRMEPEGDMENSSPYPALHPNDGGYAKMAQVWYNAITNILPNNT